MSRAAFHRRELLKIAGVLLGADLLDAQHHDTAGQIFQIPADYQPRFFSPAEYDCAAKICELILPSDADSPGAIEAGVPWFIDTVLYYADAERQQTWRSGLKAVDALANQLRGNAFLNCSPEARKQVIETLARNEELPVTSEEKFFVALKDLTVQAFCLSDLGMKQYLRYHGNTAIPEFSGCPHEHAQL